MQLPDLDIAELQTGHYPPQGDDTWADNLESAIYFWTGFPSAPSIPEIVPDRPAIGVGGMPVIEPEGLPLPGIEDWHNRYDGRQWRFDEKGVYIHEYMNGRMPLRTRGEPISCRTIWQFFSEDILHAAKTYDIPIPAIMMVIATESAFARKFGFTGPSTFRWEPHVEVKDVSPPVWGDYSAGLMQTLATTARWVIKAQNLNYDSFSIAPVFEHRPEPPETLPLYDAAVNIDIGVAEMKQRISKQVMTQF